MTEILCKIDIFVIELNRKTDFDRPDKENLMDYLRLTKLELQNCRTKELGPLSLCRLVTSLIRPLY
jgi:hypothetical protein